MNENDCALISFEDKPGEVIELHFLHGEERHALVAFSKILLYDSKAVFVTSSTTLQARMEALAAKILKHKGE